MVSPSTTSPHPPSEDSVQPSSVLINEFYRRLLNPGVVSAFEQDHRRVETQELTERVVRPRWVLLPAAYGGSDGSIVAANVHDVKPHHDIKTKSLKRKYQSNNNDDESYELDINPCYSTNDKKSGDERYINGIPTRNYIDLRMAQNRMFADDQSSKCNDILSTIKEVLLHDQSSSGKKELSSSSNNINGDELEKHSKLLHSLLHEGLSACPNHVGLLKVQTNYAEWLEGNVDMLVLENTTDDTASTKSTLIGNNYTQHDSTIINITTLPLCRKGLEGRAHAAMSDVLTERSFLTYGGGGGDDGDATMIRGYSLLPPTAVDEHHGELSSNESPPGKDHKERRRKHDRRRRRRSKDDRSSKRMRRIEYDQSSSPLLHDHHHRRRSQSCESSGSNRSEISRSSAYTHSSSSYSRRRRRQHSKEKKRRRNSKSKTKKSKKSKHRRKSRSCDTTGEEEGNSSGGQVVVTLEEASI